MALQDAATRLLLTLGEIRENGKSHGETDGAKLAKLTGLPPNDINDAVALLERSGYVEWIQYSGTEPFDFGAVWITPLGRYEAERVTSYIIDGDSLDDEGGPLKLTKEQLTAAPVLQRRLSLPPTPIGSPYGFDDKDWEIIAQCKARSGALIVVMGYQFQSSNYDSKRLKENVHEMFRGAVERYSALSGSLGATLDFRALAAGYGEHLFNEIARDIISSDIAVFDTSDLNPNVMLELGVALTWGVRVLPIKVHTQPKPPSDISGQTWADYFESASRFRDPEHEEKLFRMVERAMRKKGRNL